MERLHTCNQYISIETAPYMVTAYYSTGRYKKVVARKPDNDSEETLIDVFCSNGEKYAWKTNRIFFVGCMMYGISLTPHDEKIFFQQYWGGLICMDIKTGRILWKTKTRAEITHIVVNENTVCCSKGKKEITLFDIKTGQEICTRKTPYDNRFTVLNEHAIINHTTAKNWEIIDPETLAVLKTIPHSRFLSDVDNSLWRELYQAN